MNTSSSMNRRRTRAEDPCSQYRMCCGEYGDVAVRKGGAVIIMVVSLMTTLFVLGLFFYSWTNQERINAEYFAAVDPVEIEPDKIFDHALRQGIVSVPNQFKNSALFAGNGSSDGLTLWSMLAHQIGPIRADGTPFRGGIGDGGGAAVAMIDSNGNGLPDDNLIDTNNDMMPDYPGFTVDYNRDGTPEFHPTNRPDGLILNFGATANNGTAFDLNADDEHRRYILHADASYTYPDINAMFLGMDYIDPRDNVRIVKPSFSLPGYFPEARANGFANFYKTTGTGRLRADQSLRPHEGHVYSSGTNRYVTSTLGAQQANSGDRNRLITEFPFDGGVWGKWERQGNNYTLDRDLDGDGIDDSIALDHDHPLINLPGGRQVVPIYFWKVIDFDGLFNTNMHGNQAFVINQSNAGTVDIDNDIFNASDWAHFSNLGLTPSEVNLSIGLFADPQSTDFIGTSQRDDATLQTRGFVPSAPAANSLTRQQIANVEAAMLMFGSPEFINHSAGVERRLKFPTSSNFDIRGRYGDDGDLRGTITGGGGQLPVPGERNIDENNDDSNAGTTPSGLAKNTHERGGRVYFDSRINMNVRPFVYPLDYTGMGDSEAVDWQVYRRANGGAFEDIQGTRFTGAVDPSSASPVRWLQFPVDGLWQDFGAAGDRILPATLFPNSGDFLVNDAAEFHMHHGLDTHGDVPFPASENAALHLSEDDWQRTGSRSRLRSLLPFNFEFNRQASRIRGQFTTESWDRREFNFAQFAGSTRGWEFNNGGLFPPQFNNSAGTSGIAGASQHEEIDFVTPTLADYNSFIAITDPFRPEVRRLLTVDPTAALPDRSRFPQMRLQLNRILSDDVLYSAAGAIDDLTAFDQAGNPVFRQLIPHANFSMDEGTIEAMVHENITLMFLNTLPAAHPIRRFDEINSDQLVQEWWARYDRQRLCRDIFVLLYTLGHGDDSRNMAQSSPPFTDADGDGIDDFVKECAQFAVNYVDAMDRDNVITKFEFDDDLSNGWDSAPPHAVYGIELQDLSFSEVLLIDTADESGDSQHTLHNEQDDRHRFLYVELRNVSPFPLDFVEKGWRLVRLNETSLNEEIFAEIRPAGGQTLQVGAGENFIIGCHDGTVRNASGQPIGSEFYVNYDTASNDLECLVPRNSTVATVMSPNQVPTVSQFNLDMTSVDTPSPSDGRDHVLFGTGINGYTGTTLVETVVGGSPTVGPNFYLSLQRAAHLTARGTGDEEWIEVDRIFVQPRNFNIDPMSQASVVTAMDNVRSSERNHHFSTNLANNPQNTTPKHSLNVRPNGATGVVADHRPNSRIDPTRDGTLPGQIASANEIKLWQPHFDRDFSSVTDLLSVPLYGWFKHESTSAIAAYDPVLHGGVAHNLVDNYRLSGHQTAQSRFLFPDPTLIPMDHPWFLFAPVHQNRWFRLFNFIEIDPRADDAVDARLRLDRRIPGRINLNTLRHEHVLAGLIDDDIHHDAIANRDSPTIDRINGGRRWIRELTEVRDVDPLESLPLPGSPFARPFSGMGELDSLDPRDSVFNTFLRNGWDGANASLANVGLFEARQIADFDRTGREDLIDYHTRHRILAKVMNNTTTKSHVFGIWLGFDLHEAHDASTNASTVEVQIGGRAVDLPRYRMFCVVDMSRLEEAFNPVTGAFDFQKFIIHRQQLP